MSAIVSSEKLSKWYGNILGISEVSVQISQGIQGLLGPNGAGKSTFMKIASGQLKPNIGRISVFGKEIFNNHALFEKIGFCPEYDSYYHHVTAWEFLCFAARIHGIKGKKVPQAAESALEKVGLLKSKNRPIRSYSLGMRQRLKLASSIIHEPELLILDEPLRGVDPLWRVKIIKMIKEFEQKGRTIIVSSHILPEIEAMTNRIILIHQGKIFAHGDIQEIRSLLDKHPHQISIRCDKPRKLAAGMLDNPSVLSINFSNGEDTTIYKTRDRDLFFNQLMDLIVQEDIDIDEITSPDDNLQAVFDYLIGR